MMTTGKNLRVFLISLCTTPLAASCNVYFHVELINDRVQDVHMGVCYDFKLPKTLNELLMIKLGYHAALGYYWRVFEPPSFMDVKQSNTSK